MEEGTLVTKVHQLTAFLDSSKRRISLGAPTPMPNDLVQRYHSIPPTPGALTLEKSTHEFMRKLKQSWKQHTKGDASDTSGISSKTAPEWDSSSSKEESESDVSKVD